MTREDVRMGGFADSVAMVAGAGSGVGAAVARQPAMEGVGDPEAKRRIADAAVEGRSVELTDSLEGASWRRVPRVNLDGTFHVLRAAVRVMRPAGAGPDPGPPRSWRWMVLPVRSPMPTVMN
ncbi:hypothetical protein [Streptomyces rapamycinicus]|uniref:Uncharacterized protein n=2 Tax=Streptomyces rapamycinicus TaxID=1226757 RepID=A0A0A0NFZ6_STRRN|nr:hypothetical protein [Streptomyces rapamycinicus]AGP53340.1 hypothetical protein M271_08600 [Streptomyces rapamycinicus NRRL 5491]MBB4780826.1 NAD(P)-dependent dehydrogenase (short-subunit alcohol dehydrogenase family) [Streptomyces rapamycinicus]RLV74526.1 hypothetical protein D3C57_134910 [Streptomyces rapamycinicus NRRL 5491]UTO61517.1 hypothetical protein LJB45_03650 [Streptomyces rapamycinicus]UTP29464.1 hypothetical protein LIV37_08770 [Streptomyces rapamycinicus NRRL 5491]